MAKRFLAPAWCGGLAVGVPSLYTPRSHASTSSCPGCGALGIRNWISKEERNALGKRVNSGCVSKPIYWGARGVTLFIAKLQFVPGALVLLRSHSSDVFCCGLEVLGPPSRDQGCAPCSQPRVCNLFPFLLFGCAPPVLERAGPHPPSSHLLFGLSLCMYSERPETDTCVFPRWAPL